VSERHPSGTTPRCEDGGVLRQRLPRIQSKHDAAGLKEGDAVIAGREGLPAEHLGVKCPCPVQALDSQSDDVQILIHVFLLIWTGKGYLKDDRFLYGVHTSQGAVPPPPSPLSESRMGSATSGRISAVAASRPMSPVSIMSPKGAAK